MKIEIDIDEKYNDTTVVIQAGRLTQDVEKLVTLMRMVNMQIAVKQNDETYLLDTGKIMYFESVDPRTFV
ncbi:MAG: hypothetical protein K6D90_06035 [Lachnospiraceae bacterium]|nr:hypothetical protein [Lachnospiraceae bacterium]